ncbi:hypothetical protein ACMHYB_10155 [Sorangium sp. So ce1128]
MDEERGAAGASDVGADVGVDAASTAAHGFGFAAWGGGFGVTSGRNEERDANTPW